MMTCRMTTGSTSLKIITTPSAYNACFCFGDCYFFVFLNLFKFSFPLRGKSIHWLRRFLLFRENPKIRGGGGRAEWSIRILPRHRNRVNPKRLETQRNTRIVFFFLSETSFCFTNHVPPRVMVKRVGGTLTKNDAVLLITPCTRRINLSQPSFSLPQKSKVVLSCFQMET